MQQQSRPEEDAFRAELVAWLDANYPADAIRDNPRSSSSDMPPVWKEWQRRLFDAGWLVPGWPSELGGRNATAPEQMIYFEELSKRQIERSGNIAGLGIIAPSIKDYGSAEQKERFLLPTVRAEIAWCLGMSEPTAGSDLAGLKTRAVLDGDEFVVNGQKVWTSGAHHADWCLCFVRTDPEAPKHKGISALIVDMKTPGVECRPFPELTGRVDFNEVFFTDARVPKENLLGELNKGWPITQGSLAHERAMLWIGYAYQMERTLDALRTTGARVGAGGRPLREDSKFRDDFASLAIDAQALMLMGYRGFSKFMRGQSSPEHSLLKLFGSESVQKAALVATEALGPAALDVGESDHPGGGAHDAWALQYLLSFGHTLPGGTSEIQRNIIAERVLGLPR